MLEQAHDHSPLDAPEELTPSELVGVYARPGANCIVADERGLCVELHVKVANGDAFVGAAVADRLTRGARVSGRVHDGMQVQTLIFAVEDLEETGGGRVDALLRLVEAQARGDERREPRYPFDAPASVVAAEAFTPVHDLRPAQARIADVSRAGMAFVADRRFEPGEFLDIEFEDDAGGALRCRVQILRAERAVYGRTRYAARIVAIGELDQMRLDRLCSRCRLQEESAAGEEEDDLPLREVLVHGRRTGLRRLFGSRA